MTDKKTLKILREQAREVFGTREAAASWLENKDNPALGCSPIEYIKQNERGLSVVRMVLGDIHYGRD